MKLALQAVSVRHPAARATAPPALQALGLQVRNGEALAVIGPSGAGKTSLLQLLACALPPSTGVLYVDGQDPWALPRRDLQGLRGRLFLAPQVPPLPPRQRVVTAVLAARLPAMSFGASLRSLFHPNDIPAAHQALERFGLADKLFERVDRLSGGERQRVGLARALLAPAELWLIDEPLSALDPTRAEQAMLTLVQAAAAGGKTLVASLHQVDMALAHFPRIVGLRAGELQFDLPADQVGSDRLQALYAQGDDELQRLQSAAADDPASTQAPAVMHCR